METVPRTTIVSQHIDRIDYLSPILLLSRSIPDLRAVLGCPLPHASSKADAVRAAVFRLLCRMDPVNALHGVIPLLYATNRIGVDSDSKAAHASETGRVSSKQPDV